MALLDRFISCLKGESSNGNSEAKKSEAKKSDSSFTPSTKSTTSTTTEDSVDVVEFVNFVVKSMVDHPEEVVINSETDDRGLLIKISCKKEEIRKIIGRNGKTINAIRSLAKGAARRIDQNVSIIVLD